MLIRIFVRTLALLVLAQSSLASISADFRLNDATDFRIGWKELGAVSSSLSQFDEYMMNVSKSEKGLSRFRILESLSRQAQAGQVKAPFEGGEIQMIPAGLKLKCPVHISWESEESLTTIREISVYASNCEGTQALRLFKVSWVNPGYVAVASYSHAISRIKDIGAAGDLGANPSCRLRANSRGIDSINCTDFNYKRSALEEIVYKSIEFKTSGPRKLVARGKTYKFLQETGKVNVTLENVPGAIALVKTIQTAESEDEIFRKEIAQTAEKPLHDIEAKLSTRDLAPPKPPEKKNRDDVDGSDDGKAQKKSDETADYEEESYEDEYDEEYDEEYEDGDEDYDQEYASEDELELDHESGAA